MRPGSLHPVSPVIPPRFLRLRVSSWLHLVGSSESLSVAPALFDDTVGAGTVSFVSL